MQAFEDNDTGALTNHQAVALVIKRRATSTAGNSLQLGKPHLSVKTIGARQATGQHGVRAAREQLFRGIFQGIKG